MAASEALLTWGGLSEEERDPVEGLRERLQAMALAVQEKDAALQGLQRRLKAMVEEAEHGRAKEAALRKRAEIAEAAEEALASQMAELEAEAYASITLSNKMQRDVIQRAEDTWMVDREEPMRARQRIEELERKLEAAMEEAGGWKRRYREVKEAKAAAAAEALEADASAHRTQPINLRHIKTVEPVADGDLAELQRRLADAERALETVHAKLQEAETKSGGQQVMSVKKKSPDEAVVSMSLQDLAGMVKLRLWSPCALTLSST